MARAAAFLLLVTMLSACSVQKQALSTQQEFSIEGKNLTVYTTADSANLKITQTSVRTFEQAGQPLETEISVFVNPDKIFQQFVGIGGAVTDASAEVFAKLSADKQKEFLTAYYDKELGIGYSLMRTNINSCDFSSDSYVYVKDNDKDLTTFSIAHDMQYRIPLIKQAINKAGGDISLFASPWSPPAFMKDNKSMLEGGKLLPEYYQSWANYFTKFIKAYEAEGIPVWGITIQNEPMATQRWESCIFTAEEERDFLKNYLGPTMVNQNLANKKILVWDHNRDLVNQRANVIFSDPDAAKYAWGLAFHWYETWAGGQPMFENIAHVKESFPDKNLLFTEGCNEKFDSTKYFFWPNAERYGRSMINDFNNGTVGWTDWNILLDETGGPNHLDNLCFSPVHANTKTGELIFTPSYYYIGHFSKFIRPKARRVSTNVSRSDLLSTSFLNENGKMATVVMNQSSKQITYNLYVGTKTTEVVIPPHAIQTLVY
ncbi:MAG: glycoside hydrolase family 30 protein [Ignavibacteriaceae bacterium]|nr:glycoside hydrolase family 30 protein [Ignavibacteriaceae bacterium]